MLLLGLAVGVLLLLPEPETAPAMLVPASWGVSGASGSASPATPTGPPVATIETPQLRVIVDNLTVGVTNTLVIGRVFNISSNEITVPISAFELQDDQGSSYVPGGGATATLKPGESTLLELGLPITDERKLSLLVTFPPDPTSSQVIREGGGP